jgi:hypothetical protein
MRNSLAALPFLLAATYAAANSAQREAQVWSYQVYLDDREIGSHQVRLQPEAEGLRVSTRADYAVRVLMIPFYRYSHRSDEQWQAGCLRQIRAETDDNGEPARIAGQLRGDAMVLETPAGSRSIVGCVRSFAYWQPELLASSQRLLNTQTGEYLQVDWKPLGQRQLPFGGGSAAAFRLGTEALTIDLWYDEQGRWLALESPLPDGGTLRYRLADREQG